MIPIGKMDRCITLQKETQTRGTDGSYKKTWSDMHVVRAAYQYRSGGETFEGAQETAIRQIKWTTRFIPTVDETYRIKHLTDLYDIVNIEMDGRKQYMTMYAVKKTVYQEQ